MLKLRSFSFITILMTLASLSQMAFGRGPVNPTGAIDVNPHPNIFETTITAAPYKLKVGDEKVDVFAYNGQVPGPEIRVKRGDRVIVHFKNLIISTNMQTVF